MATILAYTPPSTGHLLPMLALLGELAGLGHRVHVRTYAGGVPAARAAGLTADAVDPRIEDIVSEDWRATGGRAVLRMTPPAAVWASPRRRCPAGVPVCAVPHGRDQFEVARRVQAAPGAAPAYRRGA